MGCERYSPLVSRFLDEDLERDELDEFLEHLFACERCRRELKSFEVLRMGFLRADLRALPPDPLRAFSLEDLGARTPTCVGAIPFSKPDRRGPVEPVTPAGVPVRSSKPGPSGSPWRFAFPQHALRYAAVGVALIIVGVWIYPEGPTERIDVRAIPPSQSMAGQFAGEETGAGDMHLYVMDHAAAQPWAHYGSHLPMIQQVAGSLP